MPITQFDTWHLQQVPRGGIHGLTDMARQRPDDFIRSVLMSVPMQPYRPEVYHSGHGRAHLYEGVRPPAEGGAGGTPNSWFLTRQPENMAEIVRYMAAHQRPQEVGGGRLGAALSFTERGFPAEFMYRVADPDIFSDIDVLPSDTDPHRDSAAYTAQRTGAGFPSLTVDQSNFTRQMGQHDQCPYIGFQRARGGEGWVGPVSAATASFGAAQPFNFITAHPQMKRGGHIAPYLLNSYRRRPMFGNGG